MPIPFVSWNVSISLGACLYREWLNWGTSTAFQETLLTQVSVNAPKVAWMGLLINWSQSFEV